MVRAAVVGLVLLVAIAAGGEGPEWSVVNVAHRGGIAPGQPENTLETFRRAMAVGAHALEIDLRGTKDGRVVVLHDETLERTTDGTGPVTARTLAELRRLDAGNGARIPTYEEVLDLVSGTGVQLLLDIKVSPMLDKARVVRLTESRRAVLGVIVGVRTLDDLRAFRALNPNLRTLGFVPDPDDVDSFLDAGADIIRLWPEWIDADPRAVQRIHERNRPVWVTAGDMPPEGLAGLVAVGVNGILTDRPEALGTLLADRETAPW